MWCEALIALGWCCRALTTLMHCWRLYTLEILRMSEKSPSIPHALADVHALIHTDVNIPLSCPWMINLGGRWGARVSRRDAPTHPSTCGQSSTRVSGQLCVEQMIVSETPVQTSVTLRAWATGKWNTLIDFSRALILLSHACIKDIHIEDSKYWSTNIKH